MRIMVLSDTHVPRMARDIPKKVYEEAGKCDLILHAGDFTEVLLYKKLQKINKIVAVCGNMDSKELSMLLKPKEIVEVKGFRIGLTHGWGSPEGLVERVYEDFSKDKVNCIVFGHSHHAFNDVYKKVSFLNPGSTTDKIFAKFNSYGIITISGKLETELVRI
jgi:hypothetical protein